jgi:ribonuclease HI
MIYYGVRQVLSSEGPSHLFKGVFTTWKDCSEMVYGKTAMEYQRFMSREEALAFSSESLMPAEQGVKRPMEVAEAVDWNFKKSKFEPQTEAAPLPSAGLGPTHHHDRTVIYTDGSCTDNGHSGARAGVGIYWGPNHPQNTAMRLPGGLQTSQRAEVYACIHALAASRHLARVEIRTDSQYTLDCATRWISGWMKYGWVNFSGKPVMNRDLLTQLWDQCQGRDILWTKVKGHSTDFGNQEADRLANLGRNS